MYVNGPGGVGGPSTIKKKKDKSGSGGFGELLGTGEDSSDVGGTSATPTLAPMNSLFLLQEVEDREGKNRQIISQGHDILDRLAQIRTDLLTGNFSAATLHELERL